MKRIFIFIAAVFLSSTAFSQTFETSYFLDNYSFGHRINPAFQSDKNVVSVVLGNINVSAGSNLGLSSILFPRNGKLVYGLNKAVSSEEFLSKLNPENLAVEDLGLNLATVGIWDKSREAYHTVEVNLREYVSTTIPSEMFAFLKNGGMANYNLSGTAADVRGYIDIAYGYSRKIGNKIKVGGRAKVLFGIAGARVYSESMNVNAMESSIAVNATNWLMIAQPACQVALDKNGCYDMNSFRFNSFGLAGFGAAVDLGVSVEPVTGLECSLAINDLGGIGWKYNVCGRSDMAADVTDVTDADTGTQFENLIRFKPSGSSNSFEMLPFTVNAGVRYKMPFYDKLSVGVLGSYHNYKNASYMNARLGATVSPTDWFSFTANYGYGTYGNSAGAMFSISGGAFNLFLGAETYLGRVTADRSLPLERFRYAINCGITFRFEGK
ncbi:MAG: DUF5723 family protein [Bacteroidales bacterium]|nr:DUF5723 family protein [Bacteroidales bacterium]